MSTLSVRLPDSLHKKNGNRSRDNFPYFPDSARDMSGNENLLRERLQLKSFFSASPRLCGEKVFKFKISFAILLPLTFYI
jgi:hypothetical protein